MASYHEQPLKLRITTAAMAKVRRRMGGAYNSDEEHPTAHRLEQTAHLANTKRGSGLFGMGSAYICSVT
jgi:hypothetical protein